MNKKNTNNSFSFANKLKLFLSKNTKDFYIGKYNGFIRFNSGREIHYHFDEIYLLFAFDFRSEYIWSFSFLFVTLFLKRKKFF